MNNTTARINHTLQTLPRMKDVIAIEPNVLEILKLAASQECRSERWQMYEMLKEVSCRFVGWEANQAALRNSETYTLTMEALDILLPTPEIDSETLADANREVVLQRLRDAVKQTFQVALPDEHNVVDGWVSQ